MLRSILVVLDDSRASHAALDLGVRLARRFEAHLSGIAVLDRPYLTSPQATGIGGSAYKEHRDKVVLEHQREKMVLVERNFVERCHAGGISGERIEVEGEPFRQIEREAHRHDLILLGKDTDCHYDFEHSTAKTVERLLKDNPRPIIVCPDKLPEEGPILLAFDGSVVAARAKQMFALLGLAAGHRIHILTAAETREEADTLAQFGATFLKRHEIDAVPHGIAADGHPSDTIIAEIDALQASMLVMGAFGHRGWLDLFLGSSTERLLGACPVPMFVHH